MSDRCNAPTGKKCIAEGMADWRGVLFRPRFDAAENQFNRPAQTAREVASAQCAIRTDAVILNHVTNHSGLPLIAFHATFNAFIST